MREFLTAPQESYHRLTVSILRVLPAQFFFIPSNLDSTSVVNVGYYNDPKI